MKASSHWLDFSGADFLPERGTVGCAQLTHYTAEYREWGEGPPLVLVPGLAGGIGLLGPIVKVLAQNFRVISYQLRGEDNCFALRRPFGLPDLLSDLREFIDGLCLERPTLFGVSFGGLLALEYADRYPNQLDRLVLQGVGAKSEAGLLQRVAKTVLSRFPLPTDSAFVNQFFNLLFGSPQKKDALFDFVTQQCWRTDQSVMVHRLRLVDEYNALERHRKIRVPTLILSGDKDVLVSKRSLRGLAATIDSPKVEMVPGAGHLAFVTQPKLLADKVVQFHRRTGHGIAV